MCSTLKRNIYQKHIQIFELFHFVVLIFFLTIQFTMAFDLNDCSNDTDVMEYLLHEASARNNRHKLPSRPVLVRIELWVQEVTSVSETTQDFEIGLI